MKSGSSSTPCATSLPLRTHSPAATPRILHLSLWSQGLSNTLQARFGKQHSLIELGISSAQSSGTLAPGEVLPRTVLRSMCFCELGESLASYAGKVF